MALTKSQIRSAKPASKRYRLTDGGGLVLTVEPSGRKVWRFRYQRDGKDAVVTLGDYPVMTLLDARAKALDLKRADTDPSLAIRREVERRRGAADGSFEALATRYMERERPHWAAGHYERFRNRMDLDVFPVIGTMLPRDIQPLDVTRAIAGIEGRGRRTQPSGWRV